MRNRQQKNAGNIFVKQYDEIQKSGKSACLKFGNRNSRPSQYAPLVGRGKEWGVKEK